mgnify:CR=1 FL=1
MSGSSMDGLDIAYVVLEEKSGKWSYELAATECVAFEDAWKQNLAKCHSLSAKELLLMHTQFGKWMGEAILSFIDRHALHHKIHLISSHGHTVFHEPALGMTFQMGDGAAIAAATRLPVVSDLRNMDVALGGQGAPIIPIGEKLLWPSHQAFLNLGGIANISFHHPEGHTVAYDVCAANRILNTLALHEQKPYDDMGSMAANGTLHTTLYDQLNALAYYRQAPPKSLSNEFGSQHILPLIDTYQLHTYDALHTYVHHIAHQISIAFTEYSPFTPGPLLVTGGGALNTFLIQVLSEKLASQGIATELPDEQTISYKEALVMALIGILRWREENNVLHIYSGASRSSVGGALWMGQD